MEGRENKANTQLTASSRPSFGHTHREPHRLANALICFSACQKRLKRTEVHNTEQNEQVEEDRTEKENEDIT